MGISVTMDEEDENGEPDITRPLPHVLPREEDLIRSAISGDDALH